MKRDLLKSLLEWKNHPLRKPLILRGARQVGKTWLVQELGKSFQNIITLNFEKQRSAGELFQGDLNIQKLIENLKIYCGENIVPGFTLLFFDEIQECEAAIVALRYFKEELPELHVISAGSLLDFTLEKIGVPVGRVQFMYLHPLSFGEFLTALDRSDLREYIYQEKIENIIHEKLLEHVKTYFWLGGMPAVVEAWLEQKNPLLCQELQDEIILSYRQDFSKYAKTHQIEKVDKLFAMIPKLLGQKFVFNKVDPDLRSNALKEALLNLEKAGVAHIVYHSSAQGFPLSATQNEKRFKVYFFDIGLAQRVLGIQLKEWLLMPLEVTYLGAMAEQFVAQEYIAYTAIKSPGELFYWHREDKQSNAEVDFLFVTDHQIVPVEVKSSSTGRLRSLHAFLTTHPHSKEALKICEYNFSLHNDIRTIPFYGIEAWLKEHTKEK